MTHPLIHAARIVTLITLAAPLGGCGRAAFGGAAPGYDSPACIENALRNDPPSDMIAPAVARFTAACAGGEAESCSALGVMNELGLGMAADAARAATLYRSACVAGHPRGCVNLGLALERGTGVVRDEKQAATLFERACAKDEMYGCAQLGRTMLSGGEIDVRVGTELLARACAAHERSACSVYGDALASLGHQEEALAVYTQACLQGHATACRRMDGPSEQTAGEAAAAWRSRR